MLRQSSLEVPSYSIHNEYTCTCLLWSDALNVSICKIRPETRLTRWKEASALIVSDADGVLFYQVTSRERFNIRNHPKV